MLKRVSKEVKVFNLEGSEIHAIMPSKETMDEYSNRLFGDTKPDYGRAMEFMYRKCIKKLANVQDENGVVIAEITEPDKILEFIKGLGNIDAGRKIDSWLLGLGELEEKEAKN